ncbi:hypothetical protein HBB16_06435 [Pseudonocardia sp. MCCB 268]|nr:hypothetical protein [Pseudonocardia cytotoxica]
MTWRARQGSVGRRPRELPDDLRLVRDTIAERVPQFRAARRWPTGSRNVRRVV